MPRVKLAADSYKDKDLAQLIRRYKYGKDLTNAEAGRMIGVCEGTWKNYMNDPARIPLGKLRPIQRKLQIPKEEILPFII